MGKNEKKLLKSNTHKKNTITKHTKKKKVRTTHIIAKFPVLMLQHKNKIKANVYSEIVVHSPINIQCINWNIIGILVL